jgi:hypothetical protein
VSEYVLSVGQGDEISIIHLKGVFGGGPSKCNHCERLIKRSALHSMGDKLAIVLPTYSLQGCQRGSEKMVSARLT